MPKGTRRLREGSPGCHSCEAFNALLWARGEVGDVGDWEQKRMGDDKIRQEIDQVNSYPESSKKSVKFGEKTLMVNAAINNGRYGLNVP